MTAIFITATGIDVGKTFIAAALIRHLRQLGHQVEAIKPIASGYEPAQAAASDPGILLAALGLPFSPEEVDRISPWRFRSALSPDLAARREGRSIDVDEVVAFCQSAIEQRRDILLIEGVGGVMVPLDAQHTVLDWMVGLQLPLVVISGSYLGAISHTLTALEVLRARGLAVATLVVDETPASTVRLDETAATIARFAAGLPIIKLPRLASAEDTHPAIRQLTDLLETV